MAIDDEFNLDDIGAYNFMEMAQGLNLKAKLIKSIIIEITGALPAAITICKNSSNIHEYQVFGASFEKFLTPAISRFRSMAYLID